MSSRKYDWNVAPKDLEKYGAPTAHASYFFKKMKVIYSTTTIKNNKTNKRIKSIFQLAFYFISCYYYYNTIKQSTLCSTLIVFYLLLLSLERCQEKFFKNILSLLAGKSEQICTAFPLTTISAQKIIRFFFKTFSCSKNSKSFLTNLTALKNIHHLAFLNFSRENLLAEKLVGSFFTSDINMNKIMKRINDALFTPVLSSIKNNNTTL